MTIICTREQDDTLLLAIEMRRLGVKGKPLSEKLGFTPRYWTAATNKVRTCDVAESGEPKAAVMGDYW